MKIKKLYENEKENYRFTLLLKSKKILHFSYKNKKKIIIGFFRI